MIKTIPKTTLILLLILAAVISCRKDPEPPQPTETDNRNQFVGTYKVYDTTGIYLYDLEIQKAGNAERDSLMLMNFAGRFNLRIIHESYYAGNYINIGINHPIKDFDDKSWHLSRKTGNPEYENNLIQDTIVFYFTMTNIAFYINEGVPYYNCECKHVAVKQ
jgi:hypothetical protein